MDVDLQLKPISQDGIPEAISKAELYRNLNEPGEAESILRWNGCVRFLQGRLGSDGRKVIDRIDAGDSPPIKSRKAHNHLDRHSSIHRMATKGGLALCFTKYLTRQNAWV